MTIWRYPVSWSKFKLALECELNLKWTIEKKRKTEIRINYYAERGKLVQFIFEQYFNQGVNLKPGGTTWETMEKVTKRILKSYHYRSLEIIYPNDFSEEDFIRETWDHVKGGHEEMGRIGLLERKVASEKKWNSVFRNHRLFSLMDFDYEGNSGHYIFDGKGNKETNADPNQLLYYALCVTASGVKVAGGGFLYWGHGFRGVDMSPEALKRFVDNDFSRGKPVFDKLKKGTEDLPANPSEDNCKWCSWKNTCPFSFFKKDRVEVTENVQVFL